MFIALLVATGILVLLTLLPLWRHEAWWVRALDFPRLQLAVIAALLLCAALVLLDPSRVWSWVLLAVPSICLVYQGWWIIPYTRLFPVEVRATTRGIGGSTISVLTANVLTPNRNADGLIEIVRAADPDIVVTLESDSWWQARLDALEADYPHTVKCPQDNLYGMHVYSRLPLDECRIEYLIEPAIPSIHAVAALPGGQRVQLHFLHPAPPSPTQNEESTERDAELVLVARRITRSEAPVIVTGDLNDVAWSETTRLFRKISGLLDPRVGRGMFNTFHAGYWFVRWPLDHVFHSHHFCLTGIRRLPPFGSDHFPLFSELTYEPERNRRRDGLEADADDRAWAREKLDT